MSPCPICKHGERTGGQTTLTLSRHGSTIVFEAVPADVCDNCGESFIDDRTLGDLFRQADAAAQAGFRVAVRSYAAA